MNHRSRLLNLCGMVVLAASCGSSSGARDGSDASGPAGAAGSAGTSGQAGTVGTAGTVGADAGVAGSGGNVTADAGGDASADAAPKSEVFMVTIPGTANLFGAGRMKPPAPGDGGAGELPTHVPLRPGTHRSLTVTGVTGTIDFDGPGPVFSETGADGLLISPKPIPGGPSILGIGTLSSDRILFLAGVFLNDDVPMDPGPDPYVVDPTAEVVTVKLQSAVFVGDGLNVSLDGNGKVQTFVIPDGATGFYLGFADFDGPGGMVGDYANNTGAIQATVTVTY